MIDRSQPVACVAWRPDVCRLCRNLDPERDLWLAGYSWDEQHLSVPVRSEDDLQAHRQAHKETMALSVREATSG